MRMGHTEASLGMSMPNVYLRQLLTLLLLRFSDLCRLTSLPPAGLLCELVAPEPNPTGRMAQLADCLAFAKEHKLECISVEMIRDWREAKGL